MDKHIVLLCYEKLTDQQIFKDVVLIPSMLNKIYGFRATIATCGINEALLHSEFKDVNVQILNEREKFMRDAADYLIKYGQDIDILFFFGPYPFYDILGEIYKKVNPKGKIYLKLDMNRNWLNKLRISQTFVPMLKRADLVTVEDRQLQKTINYEYNCEVEYLRNGYYDFSLSKPVDYNEKSNIILNVGRIGSDQKQTEVLIKAFLKADLKDWKLRLVGNVDDSFYEKLNEFENDPKFIEKVEFAGVITDKKCLYEEYRKAKIFAMSSKLEACAHVYSEAALNACYTVSTDVDGISDIYEYSSIVPVGDVDAFALALENAVDNEEKIKEDSLAYQEYVVNECNWNRIIERLYLLFCVKGLI